jgi:hypothetical protein
MVVLSFRLPTKLTSNHTASDFVKVGRGKHAFKIYVTSQFEYIVLSHKYRYA